MRISVIKLHAMVEIAHRLPKEFDFVLFLSHLNIDFLSLRICKLVDYSVYY